MLDRTGTSTDPSTYRELADMVDYSTLFSLFWGLNRLTCYVTGQVLEFRKAPVGTRTVMFLSAWLMHIIKVRLHDGHQNSTVIIRHITCLAGVFLTISSVWKQGADVNIVGTVYQGT